MQISDQANIRGLAARVITSAVEEFLFGHPDYRVPSRREKYPHMHTKAQLSAFTFLASPAFDFWADAANIDLSLDTVLANPEAVRKVLQEKPHTRKREEHE